MHLGFCHILHSLTESVTTAVSVVTAMGEMWGFPDCLPRNQELDFCLVKNAPHSLITVTHEAKNKNEESICSQFRNRLGDVGEEEAFWACLLVFSNVMVQQMD